MPSYIIRSILLLGTGFICGNLYSDETKRNSVLLWFQDVFEKGIGDSFLRSLDQHEQLNKQQEIKIEATTTKDNDKESRSRPSDGARQLLFDANGRLKRRFFE